jgi:hypothetical protein
MANEWRAMAMKVSITLLNAVDQDCNAIRLIDLAIVKLEA